MRKVVLACLLAIGVSVGGHVSAEELPFGDVGSNHWGYSAIQWAYDHQIVGGYPDGTLGRINR